jgi:hypothetical protein
VTLKTELIFHRTWPKRHELEIKVFSDVEGFYTTPAVASTKLVCDRLAVTSVAPR